MLTDLKKFLSKCDVCQRNNKQLKTHALPLTPIPVKTATPWYKVCILVIKSYYIIICIAIWKFSHVRLELTWLALWKKRAKATCTYVQSRITSPNGRRPIPSSIRQLPVWRRLLQQCSLGKCRHFFSCHILMSFNFIHFRLGFPKILISDQGKEFNNDLLKNICEILGTDHRRTSAYHPQCNGLTGMWFL